MRITRTDDPAKGGKQTEDLEAMDVSELQAKYKEVLGVETISRNKEVLIDSIRRGRFSKEIREKRAQRKKAAGAKAEAETPTMTQRLVAIANMKLPELREEYQRVFGKPSLSRNRKALLVRIAEKLQADDAAATETPTTPVAKPTLTVKFERKGGKKAGGNAKGRTNTKVAAEAKETAQKRNTTRRAGQRDPRLPKVGTTIERVYKGKRLLVTVTEDGFTFGGKPYRSLSALAMAITGAKAMNGFLFFCLGKYAKKEKAGK
jgi:hypothetical protein